MFLGVTGVAVNKLNACGLTPVVSKVSSGALEFMPIHSVKFVAKFFQEAKKQGYKIVSTNLADDSSDSLPLEGEEDDDAKDKDSEPENGEDEGDSF